MSRVLERYNWKLVGKRKVRAENGNKSPARRPSTQMAAPHHLNQELPPTS